MLSELTCHWRRSTWAAAPRWSASTPVPFPGGPGTYHWTRWCHRTRRPTLRWTSRRYTPLVFPPHAVRVWTPGASSAPGPSECAGLQSQQKVRWLYVTNSFGKICVNMDSVSVILNLQIRVLHQDKLMCTCDLQCLTMRKFLFSAPFNIQNHQQCT